MKDKIKQAMEKACGFLPEGYQIVIRLENGAASVELELPNNDVLHFCHDGDIAEDIESALEGAQRGYLR